MLDARGETGEGNINDPRSILDHRASWRLYLASLWLDALRFRACCGRRGFPAIDTLIDRYLDRVA